MTELAQKVAENPWLWYLAGGAGVVGLGYLVNRYRKVRLLVYGLVLYMQEIFKEGEGKKKKEAVIANLYNLVPSFAKWFIRRKTVEKWIEWAVSNLIDYLDDGKLNKSNQTTIEKANRELDKRLRKDGNFISFDFDGKF